MNTFYTKARSVVLYGSAVALGLILCKAFFLAGMIA
jgi:hypothetical protein